LLGRQGGSAPDHQPPRLIHTLILPSFVALTMLMIHSFIGHQIFKIKKGATQIATAPWEKTKILELFHQLVNADTFNSVGTHEVKPAFK